MFKPSYKVREETRYKYTDIENRTSDMIKTEIENNKIRGYIEFEIHKNNPEYIMSDRIISELKIQGYQIEDQVDSIIYRMDNHKNMYRIIWSGPHYTKPGTYIRRARLLEFSLIVMCLLICVSIIMNVKVGGI